MPAHLRSFGHPCSRAGCGRPVSKVLHNTWNAIVGYYCARHAEAALRDFQKRHEGGGS